MQPVDPLSELLGPMKNLTSDETHARECHERWIEKRNRSTGAADCQDEWYAEQCGGCAYYIRLRGALESDWGVCSNERSRFDRSVMFEHDGCESFEQAEDAWAF